jgi:hypothetical protein
MQKTAQKRTIPNKLREMSEIPMAAVEGFFKPEKDRIMKELKVTDDNIRTILTGQKIGNATVDIGSDGTSIKDLLKSARSNFNRREYIASAADLGRFHKKMYDVKAFINKLGWEIDKIHHRFLFEGYKDKGYDKHLDSLQEHMARKAAVQDQYFIKMAANAGSIMDFFSNIATKRGRALATWEKKYPDVAKRLREGLAKLLVLADSSLSNTLSLLKEMGSSRATRNIDAYQLTAKKIAAEFDKFDGGDKGFKTFYDTVFSKYLADQKRYETEENKVPPSEAPPETPPAGASPNAAVVVPVAQPGAPTTVPAKTVTPNQVALMMGGPGASAPGTPPPAGAVSNEPHDTEREALEVAKFNHTRFLHSLEALSQEDPRILAAYISKYAKSIQSTNPESAIELFAIVKQIRR